MLRLVYRSYGGENWKGRPSFYSKRRALMSFVRAVEQVGSDVEVLFVNDGPVAPEIIEVQRSLGRIIELPRLGLRGSYVFGLRLPVIMGWPDDDVVWYGEDDYLYRPEALARLASAATALPEADYFALYGFPPGSEPEGTEAPTLPRGWRGSVAGVVDGVRWERILSTTSSFGGRAGALRADYGIFRFCMVPHKNMLRDHDTCVVVQGYEPHDYAHLARSVVEPGGRSRKEWARDTSLVPFLLATNLRAHRKLANRRLFVAASPNLATHMELGLLSPGHDWAAVAADVDDWEAGRHDRGVHLDTVPTAITLA